MERTIIDDYLADEELDAASVRVLQGFRDESGDSGPDLAVDGLSESLFVRICRSLTSRRSGRAGGQSPP